MANVRAALKTALAALTPNGNTVAAFDWGSNEKTLSSLEGSVFTGVGLFIGDAVQESEYQSHGYRIATTDYTVFVAEKRLENEQHLALYLDEITSDLALSNLGIGNVLSVEVTGHDEIEKPIAEIVWQPITITVQHLVEVNLASASFNLNAERPTCTIIEGAVTTWAEGAASSELALQVTFTAGSGTLSTLYVTATCLSFGITTAPLKSWAFTYAIQSGDTSQAFRLASDNRFDLTDTVTITAIVTDEYGLSNTDSMTVTISLSA